MAKTKNVMDFSPAATRIYNAAKKGITNRTNASHVKRVIDKELDKHSLSKERIQKEISSNVDRACAVTIEEMKKSSEKQVSELESEKKLLIGQVDNLTEDRECLLEKCSDLKKAIIDLQKPPDKATSSDYSGSSKDISKKKKK